MSIEDDVRAAMLGLLRGEVARYGSLHTTRFHEISNDQHYWLAKINSNGELVLPNSTNSLRVNREILSVFERVIGVDILNVPPYQWESYRPLGPLGLAALRASLGLTPTTTTVVVEEGTTP